MLYSLKRETGPQRPKNKSANKIFTKTEIIPTCSRPIHTLIWINHPTHLFRLPIIHNKNTMDKEFLVQTRQSNKCQSVRNEEIFNLHLGSGVGAWVSIPCLLQDTSHIYWFHSPKQLTRKKSKNQGMRINYQKIVSYCLGLHRPNPGLRE